MMGDSLHVDEQGWELPVKEIDGFPENIDLEPESQSYNSAYTKPCPAIRCLLVTFTSLYGIEYISVTMTSKRPLMSMAKCKLQEYECSRQ